MRRNLLFMIGIILATAVEAQSGWDIHPGLVCDRQWRNPVATLAELPSDGNYPGDARLVLDDNIYYWDGATWIPVNQYVTVEPTNVFIGAGAGGEGLNTTCIGLDACGSAAGINGGVILGAKAGYGNVIGDRNTFVGKSAGENTGGSQNVCLGYMACRNAVGDDLLYIANSETASPLIWGNFASGEVRLGNAVTIRDGGVIHLVPLSGPPPDPEEGDVYYDATKKDLCVYDGSVWTGVKGPC